MAANSLDEVFDRIDALKGLHEPMRGSRERTRTLLNGGPDAVRSLLGNQVRDVDLIPAPGLMEIALDRIAQKLGGVPRIRIADRPGRKQKKTARAESELLEQIVTAYDQVTRMKMQLPQLARWVPGYGFGVWVIREGKAPDGHRFPVAELRNPYDCYPGSWGPEQQPNEMAVIRRINPTRLAQLYPHAETAINANRNRTGGAVLLGGNTGGWEGARASDDVEVATYYDEKNQWVVLNGRNKALLDITPNLIDEPHFVVAKRFTFDELTGAFDHLMGAFVQFIKLTMLGMVATEDAVFTETNIFGNQINGEYRKGRMANNEFEANARVEKPQNTVPFQTWTMTDRAERHFRLGANYTGIDDGESPNSFATGRGIDSLGTAGNRLVDEYKLVFADALESLDRKRLKWDQELYGGESKPIAGRSKGDDFSVTYDPATAIDNRVTTERQYGVISGIEDPREIVSLLQMFQGTLMDQRTAMEHIDNLGAPVTEILARIDQDRAKAGLMGALEAQAQNGDPRATLTQVEIFKNPHDITKILDQFYTPNEPEVSPEQEEFLGAGQGAGAQPPDVTTVLSRLTGGGNAEGGVQTVGQL